MPLTKKPIDRLKDHGRQIKHDYQLQSPAEMRRYWRDVVVVSFFVIVLSVVALDVWFQACPA